jgi:hypothetical protein
MVESPAVINSTKQAVAIIEMNKPFDSREVSVQVHEVSPSFVSVVMAGVPTLYLSR